MTFREEIFQAAKKRKDATDKYQQALLSRLMDANMLFDREDYLYTPVESWFKTQTSEVKEMAREWRPEIQDEQEFIKIKMVNGELTVSPMIEGISIRKKELKVDNEQQSTPALISNLLSQNIYQIIFESHVKPEHAILIERSIEAEEINGSTIELLLKAGGKVQLVEIIPGSSKGASFHSTHINLERNAHMEHLQLSKNGKFLLHETKISVKEHATYQNITITVGGQLARKNLILNLLEAGATAESYSLTLARGSEHVDLASEINHVSADTQSKQVAKAIIDDEAKTIFSGKIHINKNAQRVNASQLNKNLILSEKGTAHSRPQLEIFADDVKCAHGSTTGQLSDEEIFYFLSRGIPERKARNILSLGFGKEIIHKLKNPSAQKLIIKELLQELEAKFQ